VAPIVCQSTYEARRLYRTESAVCRDVAVPGNDSQRACSPRWSSPSLNRYGAPSFRRDFSPRVPPIIQEGRSSRACCWRVAAPFRHILSPILNKGQPRAARPPAHKSMTELTIIPFFHPLRCFLHNACDFVGWVANNDFLKLSADSRSRGVGAAVAAHFGGGYAGMRQESQIARRITVALCFQGADCQHLLRAASLRCREAST
jgi:hypothetical protein